MSILKNPIKSDFTQIPNEFINQRGITPTARATYVYLCSKPDSWVIIHTDVSSAIGVSEKPLRNAISELIDLGWLSRKKRRDGKFDYTICITCANGKKVQEVKTTTSPNIPPANTSTQPNVPPAECATSPNVPLAQTADLSTSPNFPTSNTIEKNNIVKEDSKTVFLKTARDLLNSALSTIGGNLNENDSNSLTELIEFKRTDDVIVVRSLIKQALKFKLERPTNQNIVSEAVDLCISTGDRGARFVLPHLIFPSKANGATGALKRCNSQEFKEAF